jgi:hypothetical protein
LLDKLFLWANLEVVETCAGMYYGGAFPGEPEAFTYSSKKGT